MAHMRLGVYTMPEGEARPVIQSAAETLAPQLQREPGFVAYDLMLAGADTVVSCTTWESAAQAEAAAGRIARWVEGTVPRAVLKVVTTWARWPAPPGRGDGRPGAAPWAGRGDGGRGRHPGQGAVTPGQGAVTGGGARHPGQGAVTGGVARHPGPAATARRAR